MKKINKVLDLVDTLVVIGGAACFELPSIVDGLEFLCKGESIVLEGCRPSGDRIVRVAGTAKFYDSENRERRQITRTAPVIAILPRDLNRGQIWIQWVS